MSEQFGSRKSPRFSIGLSSIECDHIGVTIHIVLLKTHRPESTIDMIEEV